MKENPKEEFLEVVDEDNQVIGISSRKEIHEKSLRHRSVHIFIFNTQGDLYLQKRSPSKDQYPEHWDTSAAGHTDPGESPLEAAQRELREELGITVPLMEVLEYPACLETGWEFVTLFTARTDAPIHLNLEEATTGGFFTPGQLTRLLTDPRQKIAPGFPVLYALYQSLISIVNTDIETASLSNNPKFIQLIERSRLRQKGEGGISPKEMRRILEKQKKSAEIR